MVKRNSIPLRYSCSVGDCSRDARCHVVDDTGVWVWYCIDHLDHAVSYHRTRKLGSRSMPPNEVRAVSQNKGVDSNLRNPVEVIPRELRFSAVDFKQFCEDNPTFQAQLSDLAAVMAKQIIEIGEKQSSRRSGRLDDSEDNKKKAYRTILEYIFILTRVSIDLRKAVGDNYRKNALKAIEAEPEFLVKEYIGLGLLFSTLFVGEKEAYEDTIPPEKRIIRDIDDLVRALEEHPAAINELPMLYRLFCRQIHSSHST